MLAIYARLSREDKESKSIENQIKSGKEFAASLNLDYKVYKDDGISGTSKIKDRPGFEKLIEDTVNGLITHVFATNQDRLERSPEVWFTMSKIFKKQNVKLFFEGGKQFDLDDADAMFMGGLASLMNKRYVEIITKKSKAVIERNVREGKIHGMIPYGFDKDKHGYLIIDKEEAEIVKRIYAMSLEGKGTDKIAEILNYEEIPTAYRKLEKGGVYKIRDRYNPSIVTEKNKSDAKWRGKTIQGIIKNRIYKGQRFWRGNYYTAPRIFDEVYWQKVNDNLQKNRNNTGKKVEHKYLLKGIIKCNCGRNMYGRSRMNKRDHTYICSSRRYKGENCGNRAINIDKIENLIWEHFFIRKELLNMLNKAPDERDKLLESLIKDKEIIENKINESQREKTNLIRNVAKGNLKDEDVKDEVERIENDINRLNLEKSQYDSRIADAQNFESLIVETRTDFEKYSIDVDFDTKRTLIHKYIDKIIIAYDNQSSTSNRTYHIQIEFKNNIIKENYIFNVSKGLIISLRDREFKLLSDEGIVSIMNVETLKKTSFVYGNSYFPMPFLDNENTITPLKNVIFPYGNVKNWDFKKVVDFYKTNTAWLSKDSGININTEDKEHQSYKWLSENYKEFKDKPIENWITFLYDTFKYSKN